jgi:preprotein translocase subunit SecD
MRASVHRLTSSAVFLAVALFATAAQAHAQFSIRAASATPVDGWERMQVERSDRVIWVSPIEAVTAIDIAKAQPDHTSAEGQTRVAVVFTDAGAKHFADLTTAQLHKGMAMILDGKVIWAPVVMAEFRADVGKEGMLAGSGPHGLTQEEVERILAALDK